MKEDLVQLGFTSHEADIYLALIEIGKTGAGEVIKKTGLHRNIVYDTLEKLIAKKLVTRVFGKNIAQFQVTDPGGILEKQKANLALAESIIPDLMMQATTKNDIIIWDGLEGFRKFSLSYMEKMQKDTTFYVIGSIGDRWYEHMGNAAKRYLKIKRERKIHWKMVSYEDPDESEMDKKNIQENNLDEVRILPKRQKSPANILIWGDSIALQIFAEPISVVEIKNKALAEAYLLYFETLWETGKKLI